MSLSNTEERHLSVKGHRDFSVLWAGRAVNQFGSAIGMVALPMLAVSMLGASVFEVSILAAITTLTVLLASFPTGLYVEFRRKRPIMIGAELTRSVFLAAVAVLGLFGVLEYWHLCLVAFAGGMCLILYQAAAQPHIKALVRPERLADAQGKLESTNWLSISVGPTLGGLLLGVFGVLFGYAVHAVSFVFSAVATWRLRTPEPPPPARGATERKRDELLAGLRFVAGHRMLRKVIISWIVFAGASAMASPVAVVFYLRDLEFDAVQFGLIMGIPSLGGFLGARLARVVAQRFGAIRGLWIASMLRTPWYFLIPLAVPGYSGVLVAGLGFGGLLLFAGMANSVMSTYRQLATPDHLLTRVATLWSFATTSLQPAFIVIGGVVATMIGARATLCVAAVLMGSAVIFLPRRDLAVTGTPTALGGVRGGVSPL
ncbi:MFS transporter [Stackebrandtia soli]|uniref:MFS transporter n=1 Tax=Stackebrandtia soli TaxID=1892856 RepID=UPI0039EC8B0A